jgi:transposase
MANLLKSAAKPVPQPAGPEASLEEARRASADAASSAARGGSDCSGSSPPARNAASWPRLTGVVNRGRSRLLRREGIYSSNLAAWREPRTAEGKAGLDARKPGNKADLAIAQAHRTAEQFHWLLDGIDRYTNSPSPP